MDGVISMNVMDLKEGCEYCNVKYGKEKLITQGCYNNLYIDKVNSKTVSA